MKRDRERKFSSFGVSLAAAMIRPSFISYAFCAVVGRRRCQSHNLSVTVGPFC